MICHNMLMKSLKQSLKTNSNIIAMLHHIIRMMWLSQNQTPSYKTINRFIINPKVDVLLKSFSIQFHSQCLKQNLIDDKTIFIKSFIHFCL